MFTDFAQAEAARTEDQTICGTLLPSGEPRYFLMPKNASGEEVRARAFEIRVGRPMGRYEHFLLEQAKKVRGVA
jgi:hypothetical protein